jgi:hypothetical protein
MSLPNRGENLNDAVLVISLLNQTEGSQMDYNSLMPETKRNSLQNPTKKNNDFNVSEIMFTAMEGCTHTHTHRERMRDRHEWNTYPCVIDNDKSELGIRGVSKSEDSLCCCGSNQHFSWLKHCI